MGTSYHVQVSKQKAATVVLGGQLLNSSYMFFINYEWQIRKVLYLEKRLSWFSQSRLDRKLAEGSQR